MIDTSELKPGDPITVNYYDVFSASTKNAVAKFSRPCDNASCIGIHSFYAVLPGRAEMHFTQKNVVEENTELESETFY